MLYNHFDCHERIDALSLGKLYIPASNLERTGWVRHNIPNSETVGQHQIRAALMVKRFRKEIENHSGNILTIQDTLLLHDLAESDPRVGDITPHCKISPEEKRTREEAVIREMFQNNPYAMELWLDYEDERTIEGRLAMEFDKLQAIEQARLYEDLHDISGLTKEFFTNSVMKKKQIQTDFLLRYATEIYENKPR